MKLQQQQMEKEMIQKNMNEYRPPKSISTIEKKNMSVNEEIGHREVLLQNWHRYFFRQVQGLYN